MSVFIAITFEKRDQEKLLQVSRSLLAHVEKGIQPVPDQYHLTLAYLGDIVEGDRIKVIQMIDHLKVYPFSLLPKQLLSFSEASIVLLLKKHASVFTLHRQVKRQLAKLAIEMDNDGFIPHITLVKNSDVGVSLKPRAWISDILDHALVVNKLSLMKCENEVYSVLYEKELDTEPTQYVYILKCRDGSYYTGWTNDLKRRYQDHQKGKGAKYTKSRLPVELVYYEEYDDKKTAMQREYACKQLSRKEKEALIKARTF